MLKNIILNPIETPRGYKNPDYGIALRGPLSQFFSGLFLRPLDEAFANMNVVYLRYQDDLIVLCQTKRQLNRCKQRMMKILAERQLKLSRKKTRIGHINRGFHFLGIHYLGTQPQDKATVTQVVSDAKTQTTPNNNVYYLDLLRRGKTEFNPKSSEPNRIVPHARTLRKARENIKSMVNSRVSPSKIIDYLQRWVAWWVRASENWQYTELLVWLLKTCWDEAPAAYAAGALQRTFIESRNC